MEAIRYGAGGMPMPSTEKKVDRTLSTVYNENERLEVQSFFVQMQEMYDFGNILRAVDKE